MATYTTPAMPPSVPTPSADAVRARERRLAERLLGDERTRGALEDAAWEPVQARLLAEVARVARETAGLDDAAAELKLEEGYARVHELARVLRDQSSGSAP